MATYKTALVFVLILLCITITFGKNYVSSLNVVETFPIKQDARASPNSCPCKNKLLCMPLSQAKNKYPTAPHVLNFINKSKKTEVFAFVAKCDASVWGKFDWSKLTTVALFNFYDAELVCYAHQQGAQVVKLGNFPTSKLGNITARQQWIKMQISDVILKFLDGINIDYEDALDPFTPEQYGLTSLVKETADAFHSAIPGSQVSFDVAWSPHGIDGRYYEYKKIADYSDAIFIMAYDEQSQILSGPCTARKLILGVPWYGYIYPCLQLDKNNKCYIKEVPFRGVNCSDAAGKELPFREILNIRQFYNATYHWDQNSLTPWFNFKNKKGQHQIWYDDERSLLYKYMLAVVSGFRGVGMYTANDLDYSDTPEAKLQQEHMWSLLP
ncbi:Di-N-acetylchitobiase [Portunus trituberculatus]|uniref:Di-N-acetylchitobiase n=1 Tax=Portunus trituberculatus TaxID=210409 RepID=A0A5B7CR76_PORTR|nr:Di-N-acetylchitobiase [Portunus trituberculatus]